MFQLCLANSPFYLQISYINVLEFQHWLFILEMNQLAKGRNPAWTESSSSSNTIDTLVLIQKQTLN